jgi:hypothetical protein
MSSTITGIPDRRIATVGGLHWRSAGGDRWSGVGGTRGAAFGWT